jgi:beta-phosphoglucomutase-like phosphatase (HAD superfamily)
MPRALIFDVDGTLAETEELHRRAFNETFAAAGLAWHWSVEVYRDLLRVAGGKEWAAAMVFADAGNHDLAKTIP